MTYRTGNHHGVTIVSEGDGARCGREGHDCARGHLVAVVIEGGLAMAERICMLLNGPPYPKRCTMEIGVRGCVCEPWPDCYTARHTPDVDHARGAAEALALVRRLLDRSYPGLKESTARVIRVATAELGLDCPERGIGDHDCAEHPSSGPPSAPLAAEQPSVVPASSPDDLIRPEANLFARCLAWCREHGHELPGWGES